MENHATSFTGSKLPASRYEAELEVARDRAAERQRSRIAEAARVDLASLSAGTQRTLQGLSDDPDIVDAVVELLVTARMEQRAEQHRTEIDRLKQAAAKGAARLDAVMARFDERYDRRNGQDVDEPGVEL